MDRHNPIVIAVILIIAAVIFAGCTGGSPYVQPKEEKGDPWAYFPTQTGAEWSYKITLTGKPIKYREAVIYPDNEEYCTRDLYSDNKQTTHYLNFRITGTNPDAAALGYDEVKDIRVAEDTLTALGNNAGAAFARKGNKAFLLLAHMIDGPKDEYMLSESILFFAADTGTIVSRKLNGITSPDQLLYMGLDKNVPGYEGQNCMHFVRLVEPVSRNGLKGHHQIGAEMEFTEDTWFAKNKGLVRLEQKTAGQLTMTWVLEKFSPGQ